MARVTQQAIDASWLATTRIWPASLGRLVQEQSPDLDRRHHIDGWWVTPAGQWRPISVRAQDGYGSEFQTFTVRDQEWHDFQSAAADELVPVAFVQSYWTRDYGRPLAAAVAEYHEVMAYVGLNVSRIWRPVREAGRITQRLMAVVPWDHLTSVQAIPTTPQKGENE